jgi:hypothetical protein
MPLHLIKLCVGAESIPDLESWIAEKLAMKRKAKQKPEQCHRTRMAPKRQAELLDGGSLFWVIKGQISARQRLLDIRPYTDEQGIGRCDLVLEPEVIPVSPRRCRPFQGWRYLKDEEAPPDLRGGLADVGQMPEKMQKELRELGLL